MELVITLGDCRACPPPPGGVCPLRRGPEGVTSLPLVHTMQKETVLLLRVWQSRHSVFLEVRCGSVYCSSTSFLLDESIRRTLSLLTE